MGLGALVKWGWLGRSLLRECGQMCDFHPWALGWAAWDCLGLAERVSCSSPVRLSLLARGFPDSAREGCEWLTGRSEGIPVALLQ